MTVESHLPHSTFVVAIRVILQDGHHCMHTHTHTHTHTHRGPIKSRSPRPAQVLPSPSARRLRPAVASLPWQCRTVSAGGRGRVPTRIGSAAGDRAPAEARTGDSDRRLGWATRITRRGDLDS